MNPKSSRALPSEMTGEVFGFRVPPQGYYLHRGHAWSVPEDTGLVRMGMDDFSQKVLGPADEIRTPAVGMFHQSHRLMDLMEGEVGVTVPDGGAFIDDVFGNYPQLGWRRLVKEFLLTGLAKEWKKRSCDTRLKAWEVRSCEYLQRRSSHEWQW